MQKANQLSAMVLKALEVNLNSRNKAQKLFRIPLPNANEKKVKYVSVIFK